MKPGWYWISYKAAPDRVEVVYYGENPNRPSDAIPADPEIWSVGDELPGQLDDVEVLSGPLGRPGA